MIRWGPSTQERPRSALIIVVVAALISFAVAPVLVLQPVRAAGDVGYQDGSYSGASAPTGREPQSKLWYNDGTWWASLFNGSKHFDIFRLNWTTQQWSDTGTLIDERSKSSADVLWDGNKLYVVSAISDQSNSSNPPTSGDTSIRVMRYSYSAATKSYSLDTGYPVTVANAAVESVSLDKDTTGTIWVTWTYANGTGYRSVYVTHSTTNTATYVAPYVIPLSGTTNLDNQDYSAIVAYNGNIGVMWSNSNDATMYFAYHVDGTPDTAWVSDNALSGPGYADNHMAIKSLQADPAGQVFATTKTSLNNDQCPPSSANASKPLILLLVMDGTGGWQRRTVATAADCWTRPVVVLAPAQRQVYVFGTYPPPGASYGSGGSIYYKVANLDNPNFDTSNAGTPFIQLAADGSINNATSTKQAVTAQSGLVVLAGDDHTHNYVHNAISLGTDTTPPTVTATSPANAATNVATSTTLTATFSEPVASATLTTSSFTLRDTTANAAVSGTVSYDSGTQTATLTPSAALAAGHNFSATITTAVTDLAGNHLASAYTWTFSTAAAGDTTPPTVTLTAPADGATVGGSSVTLSATASDNVAVDHVDFLVDSAVVGTVTSAPYSMTWDSTSVSDGSHTVTARAVDPSGNSATDTHAITVSNAPPPTGSLFSDGFESGDFSAWSSVSTSGGGTATVQGGTVQSGSYAAQLTESSSGGSYANVLKSFASDQTELTLSGDFNIAGEGSSNQNIPLFRLFDSSGKRRLSLYRQDVSGSLNVWDGSGYHSTTAGIALNTWAHVELHVISSPSSGAATVEITLNGTRVYSATNATLPPVRTLQIGNETKNQPMNLFVDNVTVTGPGGAPTAPDTTITSAPTGTVNSSSASFTFTSTISGSTFACSLDGAAFSACTSPANYSGLGDGLHAFSVAATANGVTDPTPATAGWTVDTTPPTVTATSPVNAATNVATSTTLTATFSEPVASATLTTSSFTLRDTTANAAVSGTVSYDSGTQTATLTPSAALAAGHNFSATITTAVTDLAGNHLASAYTWTFSTTAPPPPPPSGTIFSDDFESGNFSAWSSVSTGGDGTATVQSSIVKSGSYAAHLTESANSGSVANARATFASDQTQLTISGDFYIAGEGASNQNIPLFRLFDSGGTRRLSLYRQDVSGGIYVWDATGYHSTGVTVSTNTWMHIDLQVVAGNGTGIATVNLSLNGTVIYQTTSATLPPVRTVQIGNETKSQPMDLYVDNVVITSP